MTKRAVQGLRISVKKDDSTSILRQDQATRDRIEAVGGELVGTARDENVSASKINPFRRPKLGPWLNERYDEFDLLVFWRMDRAVRSMTDLHRLMDWANKHKKEIIFCDGPGAEYPFDFSDGADESKREMSLLFATVISWAARLESRQIGERVKSSHKYLRENGEWGGGVVPYGLMPLRKDGQKRGWVLVHSPETLPILQEIIDRVISGERLLPICKDFNARGVLTPRDYWDKIKGRERPEPRKWNTPGMKLILQSRVLLGEWVYDGALNVDLNGDPIERCDPIVTQTEWYELQSALAQLSMKSKQRYSAPNPLLDVATCARCGLPYYMKQEKQKGRVYSNLSCSSRHGDQHESCGQSTISLRYAEALTEQITLSVIGAAEVMRRIYIPGSDQSEEKARLEARLTDLEDEYDAGLIKDRDRYLERKKRLHAQLETIGPVVVRKSSFDWVGTGRTYEDVWPELDAPSRLKLLTDLGIKIYFGRGESDVAEAAYNNLTERPGHNLAFVLDERDTNRMLKDIHDGTRVRKDLRVWFLQQADAPIHELVARKSEPS